MNFTAAIWAMVLGVIIPISMLADSEITKGLPAHVPVLWLITSVIGFIVPCFLVKFKLYKIAAALTSGGAVSLLILSSLLENAVDGFGWFYMPLLVETGAVVLIAVLISIQKRQEKHNAPAESILGGRKKGGK